MGVQAWEMLFDSVDTVHDCMRIATGVISTVRIDPQRMLAGLSADMLATDLAEYLVRKGERTPLPFLSCSISLHSVAACMKACCIPFSLMQAV